MCRASTPVSTSPRRRSCRPVKCRVLNCTDVLVVEGAIDVERFAVPRVDEARVRRAHLDVRIGERALKFGAERERDVAVLKHAGFREPLGHVDARGRASRVGVLPVCLMGGRSGGPTSFTSVEGFQTVGYGWSDRLMSNVTAAFGTEK